MRLWWNKCAADKTHISPEGEEKQLHYKGKSKSDCIHWALQPIRRAVAHERMTHTLALNISSSVDILGWATSHHTKPEWCMTYDICMQASQQQDAPKEGWLDSYSELMCSWWQHVSEMGGETNNRLCLGVCLWPQQEPISTSKKK